MRNEEEQQPQNSLIPALRFPEFQDAGEWEEIEFSRYIKLYRGSSPRPIQDFLSKDDSAVNWIKIGDTKNACNSIINQVEEKITPKGAEKSRKVEKGELILANSMSFGKTYELAIEGYIYDGWFVLREYEDHFHKPFLLQLLNSDYMQTQYQRLSAGGIVQNISSEIVYNTMLFHTSLPEQRKIADCLSSLDEWITAEGEKLEALKAHKKGLMQQLFPAQGETVPRLRFPEFQDSEEWEEKTLGEIGNFIGGGTPDTTNAEYWDGEIQWFTPTEVKEGEVSKSKRTITIAGLQNSSAKLLPIGTILITTRATIGDVAITQGECCTNQGFQSLVVHNTEINKFWYYWILQHKNELLHRASGSTFAEIGKNEITKIPVLRPLKNEQQKIADCLSSLDELITAQAEQVALLKAHKKGLMQRLFP